MEVTNTTVFNTDDVMAYVNFFFPETDGRRAISGVKIRYLNKPKKSWYRDKQPKWAYVNKNWQTNLLDVGILRYPQMIAGTPLMALAHAANDYTFAPPKLVADLIAALDDSAYTRGSESEDANSLGISIRVLNKANKKDKQIVGLRNLRAKVKAKRRTLKKERRELVGMKKELARLTEAIPHWETVYLPDVEKELTKMEARLAKKEQEAKDNGLWVT